MILVFGFGGIFGKICQVLILFRARLHMYKLTGVFFPQAQKTIPNQLTFALEIHILGPQNSRLDLRQRLWLNGGINSKGWYKLTGLHWCRCKIVQRFQKSHLENQPMNLSGPKPQLSVFLYIWNTGGTHLVTSSALPEVVWENYARPYAVRSILVAIELGVSIMQCFCTKLSLL